MLLEKRKIASESVEASVFAEHITKPSPPKESLEEDGDDSKHTYFFFIIKNTPTYLYVMSILKN
jgi:hypothetical protein